MSRTPVVSDFKGASFKGVDFARYLTGWEDTRQPRIAHHQYNKRDGGEAEYMGRKAHVAVAHLCYIGPTWQKDFLRLQASIDDDPIGTLVHPLYGSMNASCEGHSGARMDLENTPNVYEVSLTFTESAVDTKASSTDSQGPAAKQQVVATSTSAVQIAAVPFPTATVSITSLISAATIYAAAAVDSANTQIADASLDGQLDGVRTATDTAIAALNADPEAATVSTANAIALAEEVYDACTQVADAVAALRPTLFVYTLPMAMHITRLATVFYGKDGMRREAEILANNPGAIPDPGAIPKGTQLLMAPATV